MTRKTLPRGYSSLTDAELQAKFDEIATWPRVKRTGTVKIKYAKFGDLILDELKARRQCAERIAKTGEIAPTHLYVGRRENILAELGDHRDIYKGKYLVCPVGEPDFDAAGAASITEARALVEEYRSHYPTIQVCYV